MIPVEDVILNTKIIMLDVDGVLNSSRSWRAFDDTLPDSHTDDPIAIKLIQRLCKETGAVCVLSSSWRYSWTHEELGKNLNIPFIDSTPKSLSYRLRGSEIKEWLEDNVDKLGISHYCIIDDVDEMLEEQQKHFVHVGMYDGLGYQDVMKAYRILMQDDYDIRDKL